MAIPLSDFVGGLGANATSPVNQTPAPPPQQDTTQPPSAPNPFSNPITDAKLLLQAAKAGNNFVNPPAPTTPAVDLSSGATSLPDALDAAAFANAADAASPALSAAGSALPYLGPALSVAGALTGKGDPTKPLVNAALTTGTNLALSGIAGASAAAALPLFGLTYGLTARGGPIDQLTGATDKFVKYRNEQGKLSTEFVNSRIAASGIDAALKDPANITPQVLGNFFDQFYGPGAIPAGQAAKVADILQAGGVYPSGLTAISELAKLRDPSADNTNPRNLTVNDGGGGGFHRGGLVTAPKDASRAQGALTTLLGPEAARASQFRSLPTLNPTTKAHLEDFVYGHLHHWAAQDRTADPQSAARIRAWVQAAHDLDLDLHASAARALRQEGRAA